MVRLGLDSVSGWLAVRPEMENARSVGEFGLRSAMDGEGVGDIGAGTYRQLDMCW